jgi:hypothetical protein
VDEVRLGSKDPLVGGHVLQCLAAEVRYLHLWIMTWWLSLLLQLYHSKHRQGTVRAKLALLMLPLRTQYTLCLEKQIRSFSVCLRNLSNVDDLAEA